MAGILEAMGYSEAEGEHSADLVLYNTCTIRDNAEQKVYSYLGRQAQRKRLNPRLTLVVAGCVAQQEGEALLRRVPELDLVMGPQHANRLERLLSQVEQGQQVVATEEHHILEDITTARRDSGVCAWVNVIYGCNERCTYCVVPSVRGQEQSRLPGAIRLEMEGLEELLTDKKGERVHVLAPERGEKVKLLEMAQENARLQRENQSLHELLAYSHDASRDECDSEHDDHCDAAPEQGQAVE